MSKNVYCVWRCVSVVLIFNIECLRAEVCKLWSARISDRSATIFRYYLYYCRLWILNFLCM